MRILKMSFASPVPFCEGKRARRKDSGDYSHRQQQFFINSLPLALMDF
jgi:hypothetical protein